MSQLNDVEQHQEDQESSADPLEAQPGKAQNTAEILAASTGKRPVSKPKKAAAKAASRKGSGTQGSKLQKFDLSAPDYYLNRELTWLNFNLRVLHEAEDTNNLPLERLKFIAIVCNNLDEFFMKRIGGLKQQLGAGFSEPSIDGRTPQEQIEACHAQVKDLETRKNVALADILEILKGHGIELRPYDSLTKEEAKQLREFFYRDIYPLTTPQGIDPAHPFPFISNLSLNLLVGLKHPKQDASSLARVKVPVGMDVPRFLQLEGTHHFVPLEEVMAHNLDLLFPKVDIEYCYEFRVTRNAVTELDEDQAEDLLSMIETELRYRKFAPVVRLQVDPKMPQELQRFLAGELGLDEEADVFKVTGLMGKSALMDVCDSDFPHLKNPPYYPIDHPRLADEARIFKAIREKGSLLLFHPYESFVTSVERFLKEASTDPQVKAIKMVLYRTGKKSKVVRYLTDAARNGKQVTAVVELKARFDEANNIQWANHLEEAGIHVTYGVVGFKTHSKLILVVRKDKDRLRRYAHIGTGNYHAITARLYTDMGMMTCDDVIGEDLTEFFNYLSTGYTPKRNYKKIIVAPAEMKRFIIGKIRNEQENKRAGKKAMIRMKMNALEDPDVTRALYQAGQQGVEVQLIVRDTCRLRPGIAGLTDSVRVISIVGRFLEHARIYHFYNNGESDYYIGSADCMKRNLESRVEVFAPVEDALLKKELNRILEIQWESNVRAWEMQPDGSYQLRKVGEEEDKDAQHLMMDIAEKRMKASKKLKRMSRGASKRENWSAY